MSEITDGSNKTIKSGNGENTLIISGGSSNTIDTTDSYASDTNNLFVTGGTSHIVAGGKGVDVLTISGTAKNVTATMGEGNDKIFISGDTTATVYDRDGDDYYEISGGNDHKIYLGTGENTVNVLGGTKTFITDATGVYGGKQKTNTINILGGNEHTINASHLTLQTELTIGDKNLSQQPNYITAALSFTEMKNKVVVNGGTNHTIKLGTGGDEVFLNGGNNFTVTGNSTGGSLIFNGSSDVEAKLGNGADSVQIMSGDNNTIDIGFGDNTVNISGGNANQIIGGDGGIDTVVVSGGSNNVVSGRWGENYLEISGGSANRIISGCEKNRLIISGGTGNIVDTSAFDFDRYSNGNTSISLSVTGGKGHIVTGGTFDDVVKISKKAQSVSVNLGTHPGSRKDKVVLDTEVDTTLKVTGGTETEVSAASSVVKNTIIVDAGTNHTITGSKQADSLDVKTKASQISANMGLGNDRITLYAAGSDEKYGSNVHGNAGNDVIVISGGSYNYAYGDAGNDYITVSKGSYNYAYAGDGNDKKLKITGGSHNMIDGGLGNDIIEITKGSNQIAYGGKGKDNLSITGGKSHELFGNAGNDTLTVSAGNNHSLNSQDGNDIITVTGGNKHTLIGGKGKDTYTMNLALSKAKKSFTIKQADDSAKHTDLLYFKKDKATSAKFYIINKGKDLKISIGKGSKASTVVINDWKNHALNAIYFGKTEFTSNAFSTALTQKNGFVLSTDKKTKIIIAGNTK